MNNHEIKIIMNKISNVHAFHFYLYYKLDRWINATTYIVCRLYTKFDI